ncbi:hypothetical protein Adt_27282 [Abeliophyllum distichum]|uniref:Uncharacterized protein n=1 Tax=Abeliophyllum distichum TaxID=126358 RepID=A0ABD1RUG6_9LAMI
MTTNRRKPLLLRRNQLAASVRVFDKLGVESSVAQLQSLNSRHSEHRNARSEKKRDPKAMIVRFKDERLKRLWDLKDDDENLPFSKELKARELSTRFKMPPTDNINVYKTKLYGYIPTVKCRNFHTTLVSNTKRWYNKLKPISIRSWPQLKQEFINTFIGNKQISDVA